MKFFRLLTAFSASFFLPSSAGDFSLFSLCRLLNLPQSQRGGGSAPPTPGDFAEVVAPATHYAGAPREHGKAMLGTRVTFPSRGKSPKARQGLCPLESPKGDAIAPPAASRNPLDGGSATAKDRFATLSLWANRSLLLHLALTKRNLLLSIRGAGASRGRCGCTFVCNF